MKFIKLIIVLSIIFIFTGVGLFFFAHFSSVKKFNSAEWKISDCKGAEDNLPRQQMVSDLMKNHGLEKLNRQQVIELLGDTEDKEPNAMFYCLGASGFGPDYDMLKIEFDDKDNVIKYIITRS